MLSTYLANTLIEKALVTRSTIILYVATCSIMTSWLYLGQPNTLCQYAYYNPYFYCFSRRKHLLIYHSKPLMALLLNP
jgi:hypothetical protein